MIILKYKKTLVLIIALLLAAYGWHWYSLSQFEKAYTEYAEVAAKHDEVAAIPVLPDNPLRRDLNRALANVLSPEASESERLKSSEEGRALLVLAEGTIDAVGEVGEDAMAAILEMEARSGAFGLLNAAGTADSLIELAHRRHSIIADIRGLSYRANHHTKEIFDRIIADGGKLTPEHARALDRLLPDVEEQFNRRSNLYDELESVRGEIAGEFREFEGAW